MTASALYLCEGSSDKPLGDIVAAQFLQRGVELNLSQPDLQLIPSIASGLEGRLRAAVVLLGQEVDVVIIHRDTDNADHETRRNEMIAALGTTLPAALLVPVVPRRMMEAWLLIDEAEIRSVAGNPRGRAPLNLPTLREVERVADPKARLREALLTASEETGRRRRRLGARFDQNRRQLLERLDQTGPVTHLRSWKQLQVDVDTAAAAL